MIIEKERVHVNRKSREVNSIVILYTVDYIRVFFS